MYHLVLMLTWLPHAVSVTGAPPAPERLSLRSVNLTHVLQWERGAGTSPEVTYRVSLGKHRGPCCTVVPGCELVLEPLRCDLTEACSDPEETYYLRVTALHHSEQSFSSLDDFHPIRDTALQPPVLQVAPCNSPLCVDVDAPVPQLRSIYEFFRYELKVESSTTQQPMLRPFRSLGRQEIPGVRVGSRYCISIRFADDIVPRKSNFSSAQCVSAPSSIHTATGLPLVLLPVFLVLVLAVLAVFYTVSIRPTLPSVLTPVLHSEEKLEVSCHPEVYSRLFIEAAPPEGKTEYGSSETDSSEDEQDLVEGRGNTDTAQYTSKASLSSAPGLTASQGTSKAVEGQTEGLEEVDLLTLTFSRDKETHTSAVLLSEMDLLVCDEMEEQAHPEEESEEECFETGYMSR